MRWISWRLRTWPIIMSIARTVAKRRVSARVELQAISTGLGAGAPRSNKSGLKKRMTWQQHLPRHPVSYSNTSLEENQGKFAAILLGQGAVFAEGLKDTQSHFPDSLLR